MVNMEEHMKKVAKRNAGRKRGSFEKYLHDCGWSKEEIDKMWRYAQGLGKEQNK